MEVPELRKATRQGPNARASHLAACLALAVAGVLVPLAPGSAAADPTSGCAPSAPNTNCVTYTATGADQSFIVPAGVTSVTARVEAAGGGRSSRLEDTGGRGGLTTGTLTVVGSQPLVITVGDVAGYGGSGAGAHGTRGTGGNGGGLSAIWSGNSFSSDPYLLAGGGGGASGAAGPNPSGGLGGGLTGGTGAAVSGGAAGGGGSQVAGGAGGNGSAGDGSKYQGGTGITTGADGGGGGGGGWFGGGAGRAQPTSSGANSDSGGGGGSGYIGAGVTGTTTAGGGAAPNTAGTVTLEWTAPAPTITSPAVNGITGSTPTITGTGIAGNTVTVTENATIICTAVVDVSGLWSCEPAAPLTTAPGGTNHTIVVSQTDEPGNPLDRYPPSAPRTFIAFPPTTFSQPGVPTTAPGDSDVTTLQPTVGVFAKYVITAPAGVAITGYSGCIGADYALVIAPDGSTATCTYTPSVGIGVTSEDAQTLSFTVGPTTPISVLLTGSITVFDANGSSWSGPLLINTPPVIPVITGPVDESTTHNHLPPFGGSGGDGDTVTVTDENGDTVCTAVVAGGRWSCTPATPLSDGSHTFTPTETDSTGTETVGTPVNLTVDTVVPTTPPSGDTSDAPAQPATAAVNDPPAELATTGVANVQPTLGIGLAAILLGVAFLTLAAARRRKRI